MGGRTTPEATVIHDGQEIVYADAVFVSLIAGDTPETLVGTPITELVTGDYQPPLQRQLDRIDAGTASTLALTVTLQASIDNSYKAVAVSSQVKWDGTDRIQTSFLPLTDDTLPPRTAIRSQATQHAPIGITITDLGQPGNPIIYCNDAFTRITGYPREEVLGNNCWFLQGRKTHEEPIAEIQAAIDVAEPVTVELRNYRKDGTMFWNRVTIDPIMNMNGDLSHFVSYQENITAQKRRIQTESVLKQQVAVTDQLMMLTDSRGTIVMVNPAFEEMTGYSAEEAIGQTPRILNSEVKDAEFYERMWDTLYSGEVWEAQLTNETKSGERYSVQQRVVPIENTHEEITHFAFVERNVTDEVVREQTVNVLNRLLRHNLRTSINVISGYAELLANSESPGDEQAAATAIQNQTADLKKLAERTETLRRLTDIKSQSKTWDEEAVTDIVGRFQQAYSTTDITFNYDIEESVVVPGGMLVKLALEEAVENAVVHNNRATPKVEIGVVQREKGEPVVFRVYDDGPGVPEHEKKVLGEGIETPLSHGSGIGLWIIEWVGTILGGTSTITDIEPRGTEVSIQLPVDS